MQHVNASCKLAAAGGTFGPEISDRKGSSRNYSYALLESVHEVAPPFAFFVDCLCCTLETACSAFTAVAYTVALVSCHASISVVFTTGRISRLGPIDHA